MDSAPIVVACENARKLRAAWDQISTAGSRNRKSLAKVSAGIDSGLKTRRFRPLQILAETLKTRPPFNVCIGGPRFC